MLTAKQLESRLWIERGASAAARTTGDEYPAATVRVDGKSYTSVECFTRAVTLDGQSTDAWIALGESLSRGKRTVVVVGDGLVTKEECFIRALSLNPHSHLAWLGLAGTLWKDKATAEVRGKTVDQVQCYINAIELSPDANYPTAWYGLCAALRDGRQAVVRGASYTMYTCFAHSMAMPA